MIAALFVETDGCYFGLDGVDPWDATRDARRYAGPHRVVAHPPCAVWCQLAFVNQKRYGHKVGDDGGCFKSALHAVRTFGGVLEHPAFSHAWQAHGLPRPHRGGWQATICGGWVGHLSQAAYGHPARKLTWLYYVGPAPLAVSLRMPAATGQVSWCSNHGKSPLARVAKKHSRRTPVEFRDFLLQLARMES